MRWSRTLAVIAMGLTVAALLAACGGSSSGTGNNGTPAANVATATATAKPKPTGVPTINATTCAGWMSVDEANSIIQPPNPATSIVADNGPSGGSCNYEYAPLKIDVGIFFEGYSGPVPIPQSDIDAAVAQFAGLPGITVNTATTVDGVGDQAAYLAATGVKDGITAIIHVFYVLDGKLLFDCFTVDFNSTGTQGTQSQLQQCAEQVYSRL